MRNLGLEVLGTTDQIGAICDRHQARRGRSSRSPRRRARCARRSSPRAASATSRCRRCRPSSSCCAAASSSPASCARSRWRTCSGRDPVVMELDRVGAYLQDRIVLVTGAGGSIGAELSRQIARVHPRLLVLLDHAEGIAVPDRPRAHRRVALHRGRVGARRLQGGRPDARGDAALQARRRLPRRRLQARPADGGEPARGGPQQRDRHAGGRRDGGRRRRRALRPGLHRQGGQPAAR